MTKTERKEFTSGMTKKERKKLNRKETREANEANAKQAQQKLEPESGLRRSARNKPQPLAPKATKEPNKIPYALGGNLPDASDPKPRLQDPNNASNKAKLAHRRAKKSWKKRHPKGQALSQT